MIPTILMQPLPVYVFVGFLAIALLPFLTNRPKGA